LTSDRAAFPWRKTSVYAGGQYGLVHGMATPTAVTEPDPMTFYQISHEGDPIAIVNSVGLAREIARCQAPGYYQVDEIPGDPAIEERQPLDGTHWVGFQQLAVVAHRAYDRVGRGLERKHHESPSPTT
jgi:hypothetical protein